MLPMLEHVTATNAKSAAVYCGWRDGRLPTVSEWMFAVRGEDPTKVYTWGSAWRRIKGAAPANMGKWANGMKAHDRSDGYRFVSLATSFQNSKSTEGILNLIGNVEEIVRGEADQVYAVGGGFMSMPFEGRVTGARVISPSRGSTELGFRCVKGLSN